MGFPSRNKADIPTLVHATRDTKLLARTAYTCPQCHAKVSELPTDCVVCGLKLVLSPHLARSFHHLFPVSPFSEVPIVSPSSTTSNKNDVDGRLVPSSSTSAKVVPSSSIPSNSITTPPFTGSLRLSNPSELSSCFSCLKRIGVPVTSSDPNNNDEGDQILRYKCPECSNLFCVDCDTFLHDTLHNCPGCLLKC